MHEKMFQKKLSRIRTKGEQQKAKHELEEKYAQYYSHKNGKKVSNIMLFIIVVAIVGYVVASFMLQYHTGAEISSTVTTCWFAFWTVEILSLAGIKISKVRKKHNDEDTLG